MTDDLKKEVKALLFSSGKSLGPEYIGQLVKASKADVERVIEELTQDLDSVKDPMIIVKDELGYKMTVRERYLDLVRHIVPETELSKTVMETLAVVVWKQPVLQSEIIRIRTNKAYDHMDQLEASGFITKTKHGRTYLIRGTQKLYDYFDVPNAEAMRLFFKDFKDVDPEKKKMKQLGNLAVFEVPKEEHPKAPLQPIPVDKDHLGVLEVYEESKEDKEEERPMAKKLDEPEAQAEQTVPEEESQSELFASEEIYKEAEKRAAELFGAPPDADKDEDVAESASDGSDDSGSPAGFEPMEEGSAEKKPKKKKKDDDDRELNPQLEHMIDDVQEDKKDDSEIDLS